MVSGPVRSRESLIPALRKMVKPEHEQDMEALARSLVFKEELSTNGKFHIDFDGTNITVTATDKDGNTVTKTL
jgi:hypothetical protein